MENRWTLRVEQFGGIQNAEISPAPLTLFVGDNNSGKSYLMTLLYALMKMDFHRLFLCENESGGRIEDLREYQLCRDWVNSVLTEIRLDGAVSGQRAFDSAVDIVKKRQFEKSGPLTGDVVTLFENLLNLILRCNRERISQWAFNDSSVSIGNLSVSLPRLENQEISLAYSRLKNGDMITMVRCDALKTATVSTVSGNSSMEEAISHTIELMLNRFLTYPVLLRPIDNDMIRFLPISRTGFLLNRRALASAAVFRAYNLDADRRPRFLITRPCSDFLQDITGIDAKNWKPYPTVIPFMERNMIHGTIRVTDDFFQEIYYRPDGSDRDIPMFLASGVVTELAPLMLILQYYDVGGLFIEEPETCLHPALQRKMARVLIRLVNSDRPVFATTHSSTVLQHFNNMIKLNDLPEERQKEAMGRYGFEQNDLIPASRVAMYEFDDTGSHTKVVPLSCEEYGFIIPTINDALHDMLDETRDTEPDEEDDGEAYDG